MEISSKRSEQKNESTKNIRRMSHQLISKPSELQKLLRLIDDAPIIGFDTEFISEGKYLPQLCLIQIAAGGQLILIDPLALDDLGPFWELLCDDRREIVVHACRSEMEFCFRAIGKMPTKLFDIQLAAGFIGIDYPIGFRTLTDKLLKINLPKAESRTVWNKRPLSERQIEYALGDVRYLERMSIELKKRLRSQDRLAWYEQEIADHLKRLEIDFTTSRWRNMPKTSALDSRELAILREVWFWRDRLAQKWNIPAGRVLRDDLLVELARRGSSDPKRISAVRGFQRNDISKILPEICAAVQQALDLPTEELPAISDQISYPQYHVMTQFLYAALGAICKRKNVSQHLVGRPSDIRELIAQELRTLPTEATSKLQTGWRKELIGLQLQDILQGRITMKLDSTSPDNPLVFSNQEK